MPRASALPSKVSARIRRQIDAILKCVPGYDPWCQANGSWVDYRAAYDAINFFAERLHHVEGATRGKPFELRRWQAAIVGNIFGWKRTDDADRVVRRFRKVFIKVARGNGKTPLAAGIVETSFEMDGEPGAQNTLAAGKRDQAGALFRNLKGMIEQDPELLASVWIYGGESQGGLRSIVRRDDPLSVIKVIAADAAGEHGGIPHITVIDELHVQQSRDLLDVFETAMAKKTRAQPLLVMITTSDLDRPSICNEVDDYAHKVRDNGGDTAKPGYDPEFLPVIYELTDDDDWRDESLWIKANPNLGVSVSLEAMQGLKKKALEQPAFERVFCRLNLNQKTSQNAKIVPMPAWDRCPGGDKFEAAKDHPYAAMTIDDLVGKHAYAGFDLASVEDLASFSLIFPLEHEYFATLSFTFCPEAKIAQRARQRIPYDIWHRDKHLIVTSGDQIDYATIEETFSECASKYEIIEAGFDPHGATQMQQNMTVAHGEGFVITVPQTMMNMSSPFKYLLRAVKLGKVIHFGNPLLRWTASNVAGKFQGRIPTGGKLEDYLDKVPVMPSKQLSADKIDPITAMVIALARMTLHPKGDAGSVYEARGVITV